jgi:putative ABC transport system permease protein
MMTLWQIGAEENGVAHAQVHKEGYWLAPEGISQKTMFEENNQLEKELVADPRLSIISRRLKIEGIISPYFNPETQNSSNVAKVIHYVGMAVNPADEQEISPQLFQPLDSNNTRGEFVSEVNPKGIVIGSKMAEILQVGIGDRASISAYSIKGTENVFDVEIVGIVDVTVPGLSKRIVYMPIRLGQELIQVGKKYNELALRFKDRTLSETFVPLLRPQIESKGAEIRGWWEVDPVIKNVESIMNTVIIFISFLLFLSACFALLNMIYVLVAERTVEIGTLMAIGAKISDVKRIFILEATLLGALGGAAGVIFGNSVILILGKIGIAFKHPFASGDIVLYPEKDVYLSAIVWAIAILLCILSSIPPAKKAAMVEPVQAFKGQIT